eukprot:m.182673 g.182673  ORF g.182673 m.182673 type:complete len:374 (-) comp15534_c0_seq1:612-1733(-)
MPKKIVPRLVDIATNEVLRQLFEVEMPNAALKTLPADEPSVQSKPKQYQPAKIPHVALCSINDITHDDTLKSLMPLVVKIYYACPNNLKLLLCQKMCRAARLPYQPNSYYTLKFQPSEYQKPKIYKTCAFPCIIEALLCNETKNLNLSAWPHANDVAMRAIKQTCGPGLEELNLNRNSDHLRIYFDAELKNLSTAGLADMLIVCTNLVSLDLGSCPIDGCEDAFLNMIHMQDLRLNMCGLNDTLIKAIGKGMPDLRILKARDHDVRDLTPLAESKAPIREIEFTRSWSCSEESFAKFFKAHGDTLRSLEVGGCKNFGDIFGEALAKYCFKLEYLSIRHTKIPATYEMPLLNKLEAQGHRYTLDTYGSPWRGYY